MILVMLASLPPRSSRNFDTLYKLWPRIHAYALEHNTLPSSLTDLPASDPSDDDGIEDVWGCEFVYSASPEGLVTLRTYGRDGEPGGTGSDADLVQYLEVIEDGVVVEHWTDYSQRRGR